MLLTHTAHYVGPCFRCDAIVRLRWTWMLLCGDDRGQTAKHVLEGKESLMKLTMRGNEVD